MTSPPFSTTRLATGPSAVTETWTQPPRSLCTIALSTRLSAIRQTSSGFPVTHAPSGQPDSETVRRRAAIASARAASEATATASSDTVTAPWRSPC